MNGARARGGVAFFVRRDSIPQAWCASSSTPLLPAPRQESLQSDSPRHYSETLSNWKLDLVLKILHGAPPKTPERAALIRQVAAEASVHPSALYRWVAGYDTQGLRALNRKVRRDAMTKRTLLSRPLDALVAPLGLSDEARSDLQVKILGHVRSQWRSGAPSWPMVQMNSIPFIMRQLREAGCALSDEALLPVCRLPRQLIASQTDYRAVAIRRGDAGLSAAKQEPRIHRSRDHLEPSDYYAGDVHHFDILFRRADGSLCTPKLVAWLDLATNRIFASPFIVQKGEGIRQEHVIQSIVDLFTDPNWGVPANMILDHGKEYGFADSTGIIGDLLGLKNMSIGVFGRGGTTRAAAVLRSRPYNPQSKVIETAFGVLERGPLAQLPGHIGGDRLKKKTENQGKAPVPYRGGFEDFKRSFATALEFYHWKPQEGHLQRRSPNDAYKAKIGEGNVILDRQELEILFSKEVARCVTAGGEFQWDGGLWRHDDLVALAGIGKVSVRVPLFGDRRRLFLFSTDGKAIGCAEPVRLYAFDDPAGAGEQARQSKVLNKQIAAMEAETEKLDLEECMRQASAAHGPQPQAPQASAVISFNPRFQEAAELARTAPPLPDPPDAVEQRQREEFAQMEKFRQLVYAVPPRPPPA